MRVPQVPRNQRPEPLLSRRVPQLQAVIFAFVDDILGEEIDADSGLGKDGVRGRPNRTCR